MGEFETLVLLAVLRLDNRAYGVEVRKEIEKRTGREVSYGAVYTALDRLEKKGYVSHDLGEALPERGGRARKYFRVETPGREALRTTREALDVMSEGSRRRAPATLRFLSLDVTSGGRKGPFRSPGC